MECTLLIVLTRLFHPEQPLILQMMMLMQIIRELYMMKRKVVERKRRLQKLLLQRNGGPATHIVLVAAAPSFSPACAINTPRPSSGNDLLTKEWLPQTAKKKDLGEGFKTYDLVDVNGGLWYSILVFTFWHDQVEKGVMPEPNMNSNYIGLYKTCKYTFQIMLTPKPKRPVPKKK